MANDLSVLVPKILARGLKALREYCIMPRLVNSDYSQDAAEKGDTIDVPVPVDMTANDVVPSNTSPNTADTTPTKVQISLSNWKEARFKLSDKDMLQMDKDKYFLPMQTDEAVKAIANAVNQSIWAQYKGVYGFTGTPGTTPFATDVTNATNARKILGKQLCPLDNRRAVLDFDAEANALALQPFRDAAQSADPNVIMKGQIGTKFGIDWYVDHHVPTHTPGTPGGTPLVNKAGGHAVGDASIVMDGLAAAGTYKQGDVVTFANHTQTYVLTADVTADGSGNATLPISPALKAAVPDNTAVTLKAAHVVNLAFHRNAFAFANRPLLASTVDLELGNQITSMQDPVSGLVMRLEVSREYKQTVWSFDMLWGTKLVRPEYAARIAG